MEQLGLLSILNWQPVTWNKVHSDDVTLFYHLFLFALTRLDSSWSKLEQSLDAFIKARKELEEMFIRQNRPLVLNLSNWRKCLISLERPLQIIGSFDEGMMA